MSSCRNSLSAIFVVCLLALLHLPIPSLAQVKEAGATQVLLDIENRWMAHGDDPTVFDSLVAVDFVHVLPQGFVSKQQQIDFLRTHPAPKHGPRHFEDMKVRFYRDIGIVNGAVIENDDKGNVVRKLLFTDVFAYRKGKWQAVNGQELPLSLTSRP
jgi:hypothetical protein